MNRIEPPAPTSNTAVAPGGVAIAGASLASAATGPGFTQVTINNGDPAAFAAIKSEIEGHERQKQLAQSLEAKLAEAERSLRVWQFWYFRSAHPDSVEMLRDLAELKNFRISKESFKQRWAARFASNEIRNAYIDDIIIQYGWVIEKDGLLSVSENGYGLLEKSGISITPYSKQVKPSFDCNKATKWYEELICSDAELASLDFEMYRLLGVHRSQSNNNRRPLNPSQADWRNKVRNICPDRACLVQSYTTRIELLNQATAL
ncbi:lysozyme inhibitor LprI family protein [Achromobacter anxifer]|uniref:lysozyme inhibitor LprI family protein n=1 Tax=Achromobacter anxifer TaxID=1287737 RepID=UPI001591ED9F|nr:hypothetical protein [Achromobacter anxifer]